MTAKRALLAFLLTAAVVLAISLTRSVSKAPSSGSAGSAAGPTTVVNQDPMRGHVDTVKNGRPDPKRLEAMARMLEKRSRALHVPSLPTVIDWDDKHPGFYEEFRPAVDTNPSIRRAARRCNFLLPRGTTDVEFLVGLTFTPVEDNVYGLTSVIVDSNGELPEDYSECIRQSYFDAMIKLRMLGMPELVQVRTGVRMYFQESATPEEFHAFIAKMHDELSTITDESLRQVYIDQIDFFECVERVGRDNSKECL